MNTTEAEQTGLESFDLGNISNLSDALSERAGEGERVIDIDPAKTRDNPYQPRTIRNASADAELNASVAESGVQQPIVVMPADADGFRVVVTGHRRRDAAAHNGQQCPAIERVLTDDQLESMSLVENIQRENMALYDEVRGVARIAQKHGNKEAARLLGKPTGYISKAVKISQAEGAIGDLLRSGLSQDTSAFYELALLHKRVPEAAAQIARTWQDDPQQRLSLRAQVADVKASLNAPAQVNTAEPASEAKASKGPQVSKEPKEPKEPKARHLGFAPQAYEVTQETSGGATLTFELADGGTVRIQMSEQQWSGFVDAVNARTI